MPELVECCLANVHSETRTELEAMADATLSERPCLQRCGHCRRGPFLVVDGQFVRGGDHLALLAGDR